MTKTRLKLNYIKNERSRKNAYKKRNESLNKKMQELCELCDVVACSMSYSPDFQEPNIWPSNEEAKELVEKFEAIPKHEKAKKMVSCDVYMKNKVQKMREEVEKQERKNKMMETDILLYKVLANGLNEIKDHRDAKLVISFANEKLKEMERFKSLYPTSLQASLSPTIEAKNKVDSVLAVKNNSRTDDNATASGKDTNVVGSNVIGNVDHE